MATGGLAVLDWVAVSLQTKLDATLVMVGEAVGPDDGLIRVLVSHGSASLVPGFEFHVQETPWASLMAGRSACCRSEAMHHCRTCSIVRVAGAESYVAIPLLDESGRLLGVMASFQHEALTEADAATLEAEIQRYSHRIKVELIHRRNVEDIREVLEVTANSGTEALWEMTQSLARQLQFRGAFVAELTREGLVTRTLVHRGDRVTEAIPLGPVETFMPGVLVPRNAATRPELLIAQRTQSEFVWARTFFSDAGTVLGGVGLLHDRPTLVDPWQRPVVQAFFNRARTETLRLQAEDARRSAEQSLWASQRRESLGVLAGGMAHDFNNLLVGIMGNAEILWNSTQTESALDIVRAAEQAAGLCRQILAYAGRTSGTREPVLLQDVVRQTLRLLRPTTSSCCQTHFIDDGPAAVVYAVPSQLEQVVMNLLTNACEAQPANGGDILVQVTVRAPEEIALAELPRDRRYAVLTVRDRGRGMEPDVADRIFEPFFSTKDHGHGLGLAAVQGIAQAYGGAITVDSVVGEGTTFEVFLPHEETSLLPRREVTPVPASLSPKKILVVDDEFLVRQALTRILERSGFTVQTFASGQEAVHHVGESQGDYDLLIVDLTMPGMDGPDTLRRMRHHTTAPAVVISGYGQHEVMARFDGLGVECLVTKPFPAATLVQAVNQAVEAR